MDWLTVGALQIRPSYVLHHAGESYEIEAITVGLVDGIMAFHSSVMVHASQTKPPVRRSWVSLYLAQCTLRHARCFYPHAPMLCTQSCELHFLMPPHPNIAAIPPKSGLASLFSFAWTSTVMYFSCKADLNFFASGFGSLPCS